MAPAFLLMTLAVAFADEKPPDLKCGAYCLYISLRGLDVDGVTFEDVQRKLGEPGRTGYSLGQLAEVAKTYGIQTSGVQTSAANLRLREPPFACIALIRDTHFVNFSEVDNEYVHIIDAPNEYTLPLATLPAVWKGEALLLARGPLLTEEELGKPARLRRCAIIALSCLLASVLGWRILRQRRFKN